jgi:hypothetical protein
MHHKCKILANILSNPVWAATAPQTASTPGPDALLSPVTSCAKPQETPQEMYLLQYSSSLSLSIPLPPSQVDLSAPAPHPSLPDTFSCLGNAGSNHWDLRSPLIHRELASLPPVCRDGAGLRLGLGGRALKFAPMELRLRLLLWWALTTNPSSRLSMLYAIIPSIIFLPDTTISCSGKSVCHVQGRSLVVVLSGVLALGALSVARCGVLALGAVYETSCCCRGSA